MKGKILFRIGIGGLFGTTIMFLWYILTTKQSKKQNSILHNTSKFASHYFTEKTPSINTDPNKTVIL